MSPAGGDQRPGPGSPWPRLAAVVASAVLIIQVVPTSESRPPVAAAAQISRLADSVRPLPPLKAGQWSSVQMVGEELAKVGTVGDIPTPDAQASVPISFGVWSNSTGTTCTSQQFGTATFAGPANAQAWQSIGLIATPTNQPVTGCVGGVQAAMGGGMAMTPIDVADLTHDPATLARELENGTTGVASVDQSRRGASRDQDVFARLVVLDRWTDQWCMAELRTGDVADHGPFAWGHLARTDDRPLGRGWRGILHRRRGVLNPRTGAETSNNPSPIVVLDPSTGALLEARNFSIPVLKVPGRTSWEARASRGHRGRELWHLDHVDRPGGQAHRQHWRLPPHVDRGFQSIEAVTIPNPDLSRCPNDRCQFSATGIIVRRPRACPAPTRPHSISRSLIRQPT